MIQNTANDRRKMDTDMLRNDVHGITQSELP